MKLFTLIVLLSVLGYAFAHDGTSFSGNVTDNDDDDRRTCADNNWQYRQITVASSSTKFVFESSPVAGADKDGNEVDDDSSLRSKRDDGNKEAEGDDGDKGGKGNNGNSGRRSIQSVILVGGSSVGPSGLLITYLVGFKRNFNVDLSQFSYNSDISDALAYVVNVLYKLQEINENGEVVQNTTLSNMTWAFSSVAKDSTNSLYTVSVNGSDAQTGLQITVTFLVSNRIGKTNLANALVTPKTIESILNITGYTLQSSNNRLALVFIAASDTGKVSKGVGIVNGTSFSSGDYSSGSQVFFSLSSECYVNGSSTVSPVAINSHTVDLNDVALANLPALSNVKDKYGSRTSIHLLQAVFPVGATNIVYDPTTGSGQVVTDTYTSPTPSTAARTLVMSMYAMLLAVFLFVL